VPGVSSTIAMRSPTRRLNKVLFPTLGLPTSATIGLVIFLFHISRPEENRDGVSGVPNATRGTQWKLMFQAIENFLVIYASAALGR